MTKYALTDPTGCAGPSRHGKTELGRRLGNLLSLDMIIIDMTEVRFETDLFGPKYPFKGYEEGSPLNNFLEKNAAKRAIVMLDELEKSTQEVMNSLLIIFDEGSNNCSLYKLICEKIFFLLLLLTSRHRQV